MVYLHPDIGGEPFPRVRDLGPYQAGERTAHIVRRDEQAAELDRHERRGDEVEHPLDIVHQFGPRGEQHHISVAARIAFVEIARTYDRIVARGGPYMRQLSVDLESLDPVDHLDSGVAHLRAPVYVALLVEPCQKLYHDSHLLAVMGGGDQRLHDLRFLGKAVERYLYGLDLGRDRRLAQQLEVGVEGMVRHMDETVGGRYYLEDAGNPATAFHGRTPDAEHVDGPALLVLEVGSSAVGEGHEVAVVVVAPAGHYGVVGREPELVHDAAHEFLRHGAVVHHPQRLSGAPRGKALLHLLHLAVVEVVVDLHLGIPSELERICLVSVEIQPDEELAQHETQHVVERYDAGVSGIVVGNTVIPAHASRRNGQHSVGIGSLSGRAAGQADGKIVCGIGYKVEVVDLAEPDRGGRPDYVVLEEGLHP